jgi:hypothetical protein
MHKHMSTLANPILWALKITPTHFPHCILVGLKLKGVEQVFLDRVCYWHVARFTQPAEHMTNMRSSTHVTSANLLRRPPDRRRE